VVEQGDNLFTIAAEFQANVCYIMLVNNITDPSVLAVGQTLIIPAPEYEPPTPTPLPTGLPRGARVEHVVQCGGETLESIASLYNSTAEDIADQNDIDDPAAILIGDVLIVRVNLVTPTPTVTSTVTSGVPGTEGATATETATRSP
jgi:LysM repeat protein